MHPFTQLGPFVVHTYGLCVLAGVCVATAVAVGRRRRLGYDGLALFLWCCFGPLAGVIGGRGVQSMVNWLHGEPAGFWSGGMSATGGAVGGLLYTAVFTRLVFRESPLRLLDAIAPAYPVMHAF